MRLPVVGERIKLLAHELGTLGAVIQMLLVDAADEKLAIGRPVQRTVSATPLTVHSALYDLRDAFVLLQPLPLMEPLHHALCGLRISRYAADVAGSTV
jgi:hypothetical protein